MPKLLVIALKMPFHMQCVIKKMFSFNNLLTVWALATFLKFSKIAPLILFVIVFMLGKTGGSPDGT